MFSACDSLTGEGSKKVVITESVCANISLLRMNLGQETKIVVDNTDHGPTQQSITLFLTEFPVVVVGDLPPDSSVGTSFTTMRLKALAGETTSVTVRPIFTGDYTAACAMSFDVGTGGNVREDRITFQIVD
jgi:hypothetical protein